MSRLIRARLEWQIETALRRESPRSALLQPQSDLAQARTRMQLARGTIDLRDRFVRGEIKREALAVAVRRMELRSQQQ